MNILVIVLAVVAIVLAAILALATRKPDTFSLQRSAAVDAPAGNIFPLINDLRAHESWSPFDKPDPATNKIYTGSHTGQGSVYDWDGKSQAGTGRIAITESSPPSRIVMQLDMLKPCKASNIVVFTLQPKGRSTEVTWAMQGPMPFFAKVMHTIFNMERMCGKQFETGLANLKTIAERSVAQA